MQLRGERVYVGPTVSEGTSMTIMAGSMAQVGRHGAEAEAERSHLETTVRQ